MQKAGIGAGQQKTCWTTQNVLDSRNRAARQKSCSKTDIVQQDRHRAARQTSCSKTDIVQQDRHRAARQMSCSTTENVQHSRKDAVGSDTPWTWGPSRCLAWVLQVLPRDMGTLALPRMAADGI
ncbi:hypothetical protein BU24DRAFT_211599 [Aaosphaeria arxii CBS 175.79]|uniref:Uncharacterized protein n=1 Tax=Aaosphaeria arxii CBS 175.79 TaxID=1450172 RepID=A0A6A5XMU1_9PLEO|nr:uncharacterized protein BU24DRAFT_211599 [Aaosphaeria arxii CBS 175.79]KAF2014189.1 hypothetical protein BU24DRAFT_211599 [Aaosphaeria arxii CBS 175.79]